MSILLVLICAIINRARGSHFFDLITSTVLTRIVCGLLLAVVCAAMSGDLITIPIIFIGYMAWASFGWGKYFSAMHGNDNPAESEIKWIDRIGYHFVKDNNKLRGVLCMGIRGMFIYPMFLALGAPIIGLIACLQGVPYFVAGLMPEWSIREAEYMWGGVLGLMLWGAL
jgi:hypothetical protein